MKRPILYIVIPFCVGIALSYFFNIPILPSIVLTILFLIFTAIFFRSNVLSHAFLYIALVFFGAAYHQNSNILPPNHIANFTPEEGRKVSIKGIIADDPVTKKAFYGKEKTSFTLRASLLMDGSVTRDVTGLVKTDIYSDKRKSNLDFGEEVIIEGRLSKPQGLKNSGLFDYSNYLKIKNIYAVFSVNGSDLIRELRDSPHRYGFDGLGTVPKPIKEKLNLSQINIWDGVRKTAYKLRHAIRDTFSKYLKAPYGGFLKAILIGDRTEIESAITDDFVKTGTVHILAISGLHVGLIAGLFIAIFAMMRIPKRPNLILTLIFLIFYSFLAGSNAPIIRAVIMFSIFVIGYLIDRDADTLNSLALAAFLILLWNPKELFEPSFQLSFASLGGIIVLTPKINGLFRSKSYPFRAISTSIAACLGTWPIISSYFNVISPIAVIANLIVIPMLFVLVAGSFLFFLAHLVSTFLGALFAQGLCILEKALFFLNHALSQMPFSYFRSGAPSLEFSVLYYLLISLLILPSVIVFRNFAIYKKHLFIATLLFFNISIWADCLNSRREVLKATFLDVGHGDSIFIEFPKGGNLLIDGGSGGEKDRFDIGRSVIAPYLWNKGIRTIDAVIVTHFHEDHLGGMLYILKNFKVGCVVDNGAASGHNRLYDEYKKILRQRSIRRVIVGEGDEIMGFDDVGIFVLNPKKSENLLDSNDNSIALKLVYNRKSILLCGDISGAAVERLLSYNLFLKSDILKVPHHGGFLGDGYIVKNFFKKVSPQISVISAGRTKGYNAPSKNTLDIITSLDSMCYVTKDSGAVTIFLDSKSYAVTPFSAKKN